MDEFIRCLQYQKSLVVKLRSTNFIMLTKNDNDVLQADKRCRLNDVVFEQKGKNAIIEESEEAPIPAECEESITLKVRDQIGEEMFFKVKKGTALSKIFDAYARRRGVAVGSLRFLLDDTRLTANDTPKLMEMEDFDQIDVYLEQLGGLVELFRKF